MATLKWLKSGGNYYYFNTAPTHISSITLNTSSITFNEVGATYQLTATVSPSTAVETKVSWSSSDESVAYVDSNGLVTCVSVGQATITASCDGVSSTCSTILIGPGIYHNATLGLISLSSDGSNWITIADKNLGATQVWNNGDALSEANAGKYYQWGNNYGFPFTGSVTISGTQVDASNYGPGNYYSSSNFIITNDWSSVQNDNLWGATTGTNEAMQGPCPSGFHVPPQSEWQAVVNILTALGVGGQDYGIVSKIPKAGRRVNGNVGTQGTHVYYWSSSPSGSYSYNLTNFNPQADDRRSYAYSIRPFKNEAVQPDASRTKLY